MQEVALPVTVAKTQTVAVGDGRTIELRLEVFNYSLASNDYVLVEAFEHGEEGYTPIGGVNVFAADHSALFSIVPHPTPPSRPGQALCVVSSIVGAVGPIVAVYVAQGGGRTSIRRRLEQNAEEILSTAANSVAHGLKLLTQ